MSNTNITQPLSYNAFLDDIQRFKRSGGAYSDSFNFFDSPSHKYYKIFFYFGSQSERNTFGDNINYPELSGLLAPTWLYTKKIIDEAEYRRYYRSNYTITEKESKIEPNPADEIYNAWTADDKTSRFAALAASTLADAAASADADAEVDAEVDAESAAASAELADYASKNYIKEPYYMFNSAWSYLMLNGFSNEANNLYMFINLLSNISIESPWYFSEVTGISDALNRKIADSRKVDFGERSKITITCLPDAFDNRIGTLLDLYRSFTMDWKNKREILPANLRKFDMAIYVFEAPDKVWHQNDYDNPVLARIGKEWKDTFEDSFTSMFRNTNSKNSNENDLKSTPTQLINSGENFVASYKLIEFHDCEFSYNSSISGWSKLTNETGFANQYNIEIYFNDCYEITYNDLISRGFGDESFRYANPKKQKELKQKRLERKGWLERLGIGLLDRLNDKGLNLVKNLAFGNLYGLSLKNTLEQISSGIKNPIMAYNTIMNYAQNGKEITNQSLKQVKGYVTTAVNTAKNTIGYSMFENEYASGNDLSDDYNISNPATMEIPSNKQVKQQNKNNSNNYVQHIQEQLGSDNNIADNNNLERIKETSSGSNIFENYTKSKVLNRQNRGMGSIFKSSTIANNI